MSQSSHNLRVMPSRKAKRGPPTLRVIPTETEPGFIASAPKKTVKKDVSVRQANKNNRTLHVIDSDPVLHTVGASTKQQSASLSSVTGLKQIPPSKPAKGGFSIAKKVIDKAKVFLKQKPSNKDNVLKANAKIPFRSKPTTFGKKSDSQSIGDRESHLVVSKMDLDVFQSKKNSGSKESLVSKQPEAKTYAKMHADKDFRKRNTDYDRLVTRESSKRYHRELEPSYYSRGSRERSYVDERKQAVPLRRSSRIHPSSRREDLYYEQRYKLYKGRERETRSQDLAWEDNDFRETRQYSQKYSKKRKPSHDKFVPDVDNLEDISDGPLDENDFEEVAVASDEDVEKSKEIPVGFSKCKVRYLGLKHGFFKPKLFLIASERTVVNCLTVKESDSSKDNASVKKASALTKEDDFIQVGHSAENIAAKDDSTKSVVSDKKTEEIESSGSDKNIDSKESIPLDKKVEFVDMCGSENKSDHNPVKEPIVETEISDVNQDINDKEDDDFEVTEDLVEDQISDSEIIEIEECNIVDESSDDTCSLHEMDVVDSDEKITADSTEKNKEISNTDASVSLTDFSSKNISSSVSPNEENKTPGDPLVEDKNTANKIVPMEVADETASRVYCKSIIKNEENKAFYQGTAKIQSHLDAWQSHLIGLEFIIEVRDNFTDGNVKKYHCWLCGEDVWCEKMVGQTVIGHINSYKHMHDYLAKFFPSCGYNFSKSTRSYNSEFVLRKCCQEINNKMGYFSVFITDFDYFSSCQGEIKELFDTLMIPDKGEKIDASVHINELEGLNTSVAENVIKSMLDIISPVQGIETLISANRKAKVFNTTKDVHSLIVLTPSSDPPPVPSTSVPLLCSASSPAPILGPPNAAVPMFGPPNTPASILGPTNVPVMFGPPNVPVQIFGPPITPVQMFGPPNIPHQMLGSPNFPVQMLGPTTGFVPMAEPLPQVPTNAFDVPMQEMCVPTPQPTEIEEKGNNCKMPPKKEVPVPKSAEEMKINPKILTRVHSKQANCLKKYMSLASAFGNMKPSKSVKKKSTLPQTSENKSGVDQSETDQSFLADTKILSLVFEKKASMIKSNQSSDQESVDLVMDADGNLVPPSSCEEKVVKDSSLLNSDANSSTPSEQGKHSMPHKNKKKGKTGPGSKDKSSEGGNATVHEVEEITILDESDKEDIKVLEEVNDKNDPTVAEEDKNSAANIDKADSDSIEIIDDEEDDPNVAQKDVEGNEPPGKESLDKSDFGKHRGTHSKYCIKRILNRSTRVIRKRKDCSLDYDSVSENEDSLPGSSKLKEEFYSHDSKLSSSSSKRKRSPSNRSSRSPSLPYNLLRALSRSRSRSKSPIQTHRRRSRSPVRSSKYSTKRRSRSPLRRFSRSPLRRKSRSPFRSRSRSPIRKRSRSPFRRQSRSPQGRYSRNLLRRRSRSPVRRRSRSPVRRRSRSPIKTSRFQQKERSRSPKRYRRSSRSPVRRKSKSPIKRPLSPKRYSIGDSRNLSRLSHYEDASPALKHSKLESLSLSARSSLHSANLKSDQKRKSGESSQGSMGGPESPILARLKNSHHLGEIMRLPPTTRHMVMQILEKYIGDNAKADDAKISEFMQLVNKSSTALKQKLGQGPQDSYHHQQLMSSLTGSSLKPNISFPASSGIPYPPPSMPRVPQMVPPPFQQAQNPLPPSQAYPSASSIPSAPPLSYPTMSSMQSQQQHVPLPTHYQPNVSTIVQQNVANLIQQPAKLPEVMFKDLQATVSKLFGPKDTNPSHRAMNEASGFSSAPNFAPKQQASNWEPNPSPDVFSSETPTQMHSTPYSSTYSKPAALPQHQFSVPPPDTKVSFCDKPSTSNRNLFPVVSQSEAPSSGNKTSNVNSAKISLAQRLAAVLVKYGMTDVSAALLQEMLMKIGAFSSNPPQDINEREIVDILKRLGYLL